MNYFRTTLLRNTDYFVENVIDYDQVSSKWDFLKMDPMKWDNFADAKAMGLIRNSERVICEEHLSSIEESIHGVAKIYSISLSQCYRRKKILERLEQNQKSFQDLISELTICIDGYNKELVLIDQQITKIEEVRYTQDKDVHTILFSFRKEVNQLEIKNQEKVKSFVQFFNFIISDLTATKTRIEKHYNQLKQSIAKMKECLSMELKIMQKALDKMSGMRDKYLYSFVFYNKLSNTKKDQVKETKSAHSSSEIDSEDLSLEEDTLSL